jgi:hypothetical protein
MAALHDRTGADFELYAATPRWLFDEAIAGLYRYHDLSADVGLCQRSALEYDLAATVRALEAMLPFDDALVERLAQEVRASGCRAVLCDIAPLGIAVAERAGLPSVLLENFLWPWIYEPLRDEAPALGPLADALAGWFSRATVHLQTDPLCAPDARAAARLPPIARPPRTPAPELRAAEKIPEGAPLVVLTMGGVDEDLPFLKRLERLAPIHFLVTGTPRTETRENLRLFDKDTRIYMPDFVQAADAVVAKLGYSTVAEVWSIGRPFAFVSRENFRESDTMRPWVRDNSVGFEIPGGSFAEAEWIDRIPELLGLDAGAGGGAGGAMEAARLVAQAAGLRPRVRER